MDIKVEFENFLIEKFAFKSFEIDSWFNDKTIYRYKYKQDAEVLNEELGIEYLRDNKIDEWRYVDGNVIDFFFGEFVWYNLMALGVKSGIKSKKIILKTSILDIIKRNSEEVAFDKRIKPFIKSKRVKVSRVSTLPFHLRKPVENLSVGDKCFIFRYGIGSKIVDPCIIYDIDEDNDNEQRYSVMYFTNLGDYGITTSKLEINGYHFAKVYPNQIGLTPEDAVKNKF